MWHIATDEIAWLPWLACLFVVLLVMTEFAELADTDSV